MMDAMARRLRPAGEDPSKSTGMSMNDRQELEKAFSENFADVRRYGYRRVGAGAADELASETFARAVHSWKLFDPLRGSVRMWLFGIAANVAREHDRAVRRNKLVLLRLRARSESDSRRRLDETIADVQAIEDALSGLRPVLQDVLLLVDGLECTYDEAGSALGIPVGTVRSRLSVGRKRLTDALERERAAEAKSEEGRREQRRKAASP